jgi:dolichol-phosphate mannosyltransferase
MDKYMNNSAADWEIPTFTIKEYATRKTRYCLCVPIINEGERIKRQLKEMKTYASEIDILILDGGSTDGSTSDANMQESNVRALLVKTGAGKLSAQLRMGYAYALEQGYEGIITIDGNGKDGVEAIPTIIEYLDKGYDYVQGSRFVKGGQAIRTPVMRLMAIRLIHAPALSLAAKYWLTDTTNGFRGYSRKYLLDPRVQPFRGIFSTYELLAYLSVRATQIGLRAIEIPVRREYPASGEVPTKISHFRGNFLLLQTIFYTMIGRFNPGS